jgi:hypothetical protein
MVNVHIKYATVKELKVIIAFCQEFDLKRTGMYTEHGEHFAIVQAPEDFVERLRNILG